MRTAEVFWVFLKLGLSSFGGPIAHLGYFRRAFVTRRGWLDEAAYAELVAFCQFLPGPTSSQVGFLIGKQRAGWAGAAAAWLAFTAPSAALMLLAAYWLAWFDTEVGRALAHGLHLVAAAIVAQAVFGMAQTLRGAGWALALAALAILLLTGVAWMQPAVIALGGLAGLLLRARTPAPPAQGRARAWGWALAGLALVAASVAATPALIHGDGPGALFAACFRAGALVFGGGHVVLPLLESDFVGRGWIGAQDFLAGYGAAQALPGPLFSFAAFLGAAQGGPLMGLAALAAIFLPGLVLAAACAPAWTALRASPRAAGFSFGAGAAVVGVLAAALYDPILTAAIRGPSDAIIALAGFLALDRLKAPNWVVVLGVAAFGTGAVLLRL